MSTTHATQLKAEAQLPFVPLQRGLLQRKCACGQHAVAGQECGACEKQRLQRSAIGQAAQTEVPPIVDEVLRSPGQPLDAGTRGFMEPRFNHDFSRVRVHADARAAESARAVNALGYTVGHNVVFGSGQYAPETSVGRELLAHELTHVMQQAGTAATGELRIGAAGDSFERAADNTARRMASEPQAGDPLTAPQPAPVLQRQPAPGGNIFTDPEASPLGASLAGSLSIDGFALGKAELTAQHKKKLAQEAATILRMLKQYPHSFVTIVGHTDAVGPDERNVALGQQRADAVLAELSTGGVPADIMRALSLGESSLLVESQKPEPRNRRVVVNLTARSFFPGRPSTTPGARVPAPAPQPTPGQSTSPWIGLPGSDEQLPGPRRQTGPPPFWNAKLPPAPKMSDPIDDAINKDPLLRKLPKVLQDAAKDALKTGDESAADAALDHLNTDDVTKGAIKAAVKALLQLLKNKKWTPPIPSPYELPPSNWNNTPMPGERILKLPPWRF